ncbi:MAG: hypothetical protein HETSPECPRED_008152 [Heterodermia speciosa]|uniref:Uncharacterized protein n=1 Tax=Heterodermia speciosa TaxID=116794 RepID=A0A8H3IWV7_9LECA|nr:MAG: hypothetical protein HETSPECPRED_008152 [Heterodermia speciosa]
MAANSTKRKRSSDTQGDSESKVESSGENPDSKVESSEESPGPGNILSAPASGLKRQKLNGPRPLFPRINVRLSRPGTEYTEYTRKDKTYLCPKGVEPWTRDDRWMLDPKNGMFKKIGRFYYLMR